MATVIISMLHPVSGLEDSSEAGWRRWNPFLSMCDDGPVVISCSSQVGFRLLPPPPGGAGAWGGGASDGGLFVVLWVVSWGEWGLIRS